MESQTGQGLWRAKFFQVIHQFRELVTQTCLGSLITLLATPGAMLFKAQ